MTTMTYLAIGVMGKARPKPALGASAGAIALPPPHRDGGIPLMDALASRRSEREFTPEPLPLQVLSDLLWAAFGINRPNGERTAPSALNAQEVEVFVALPQGAYRYEPVRHELQLVAGADLRRITGYQDFVDDAALDLVYVADHGRMGLVPVAQREAFAHVCAGAIAQNVYLFAASHGLATVIRAWINRSAIADALGLGHDEQVMLSQTVGYRKATT